jgi:NACHT domain.
MSLSESDSDAVVVDLGDVQDFNSDNILPLPAKDLAEITKWLQPTPYDCERSEYSRHRASHLLGTGTWLTSTDVYQQWHSGGDGLLWIKGIPGSGKSVMAASIIKQLQKEHVPVVYFFFRQIIEANHKPIAALRDWLCQVLNYSPPLQVKLHQYLKQRRSLDSLSPTDLWSDLKMALDGFPRAYCVTDALDEMGQGNAGFLEVWLI